MQTTETSAKPRADILQAPPTSTATTTQNFRDSDARVQRTILHICSQNPELAEHYSKFVDTETFKNPVDNSIWVKGAEKIATQQRLVQVVGALALTAGSSRNKQKRILTGTLNSITEGKVRLHLGDNSDLARGVGGTNQKGEYPPLVILNREQLEIEPSGLSATILPKRNATCAGQTLGTLAHLVYHASVSYAEPHPPSGPDRYREEMVAYNVESIAMYGRNLTPKALDDHHAALTTHPYNLNATHLMPAEIHRISQFKSALSATASTYQTPIDDLENIKVDGQPVTPTLLTNDLDLPTVKANYDRIKARALAAFAGARNKSTFFSFSSDDYAREDVKKYSEFLPLATPLQREHMVRQLWEGSPSLEDSLAILEIIRHAPVAERAKLRGIAKTSGGCG